MKISRVGVDLAKSVFQLHGVDTHGKAVWKRRLSRNKWIGALCKAVIHKFATIEEKLRIPIWLITPKILDREIQENSHLSGQIFPFGKDCVYREIRDTPGLKKLH